MNVITYILRRFGRDRDGVTALEYGLIASLVAIAIVTAVTSFGTKLGTEFTYIGGKI